MSECYGHAIRSYGFALQSGRVASTNQLNGPFLSKCLAQIAAAGDDAMTWSEQSAYGTSFPAGTAAGNIDYQLLPTNTSPSSVVFAPGATQVTLIVVPMTSTNFVGPQIVVLTSLLMPVTLWKIRQGIRVNSLSVNDAGATLHWNSISNRNYRVGYKDNLTIPFGW